MKIMQIAAVLLAGLSSTGCSRHTVLIDPSMPHRLAPDQVVEVYPRGGESLIKQPVRVGHRWIVLQLTQAEYEAAMGRERE